MLIVSLIAVVGTLCWLVFTFAVYAVPAFVGLSAAMFAHQTGAGTLGTIAVGLFAGAVTLVLGQRLIASLRSPALRLLVTALFATPAGLAGYHAVHGLMAMGSPASAGTSCCPLQAVSWSALSRGTAWAPSRGATRADRRAARLTHTPFRRIDVADTTVSSK